MKEQKKQLRTDGERCRAELAEGTMRTCSCCGSDLGVADPPLASTDTLLVCLLIASTDTLLVYL